MSCIRSVLRAKLPLGLVGIAASVVAPLWAQEAPEVDLYPNRNELTLERYMQRVVEFNETVQGRLLGFHSARRARRAEEGTFEPAFISSWEWLDKRTPNTIQIERSLRSGGLLQERNTTYTAGVELLTPFGTNLRVVGVGRELTNNIQRTELFDLEAEYETSLNITVEQPLMKGAGYASNLAPLRLAALESDISFQEYRREFMQVVAEAELAYWNLYFAQEELQLSKDSVALARTLLQDSQSSFEAGRGTRLDVLEAEAGLALRLSRLIESQQRRIDALNQLASFFSGAPRTYYIDYVAIDAPVSREVDISYDRGLQVAMEMNPDLLRARAQTEQERIRVGYAKNQRLPDISVRASYGSSGLGYDWDTAFEDIEYERFPAWTVALVVRLPIWGDLRGRYTVQSSNLRLRQSERVESNVVSQLRLGRDTAQQRVEASYVTARNLEEVVSFRRNLLETRLQSRDLGRMDARSVLEAEQELFVARLEQLQSEIQYQRALLELQVLSGNLLQLRGMEMSFEELEARTRNWVDGGARQLPELKYSAPSFDRLPAEAPVIFERDEVKVPWFGRPFGG